MIVVNLINRGLKKLGAELCRYPNLEKSRRIRLLNSFQINKVFDVGANIGEYSTNLRSLGFTGNIIAFEPLLKPFEQLKKLQEKDPKLKAFRIALGDEEGEFEMNISENVNSSSISEMLVAHIESAPTSKYVGKEKVVVKNLDKLFSDYYRSNDLIWMKVDTQGYEQNVLDGASNCLSKIKIVQLELSIIPLYKNCFTYLEAIAYMEKRGFELYGIEPGFSNVETGQLLQFDGIFVNKDA